VCSTQTKGTIIYIICVDIYLKLYIFHALKSTHQVHLPTAAHGDIETQLFFFKLGIVTKEVFVPMVVSAKQDLFENFINFKPILLGTRDFKRR
jgi:hypothetical protein